MLSTALEDALRALAVIYGSLLLGLLPFAVLALALWLWRRYTDQGKPTEARDEVSKAVAPAPRPAPAPEPPGAQHQPGQWRMLPPAWPPSSEPEKMEALRWAAELRSTELEPHLLNAYGPDTGDGLSNRAKFLAELEGYRSWTRYETEKISVRAERIARAGARERTRLALANLASAGFYVFEDLLTDEAGAVDQFAIGPAGMFLITVRHEEGLVWRAPDGRLTIQPRYPRDDADLLGASQSDEITEARELIGFPFEEDIEAAANDLILDMADKNFLNVDHPVATRLGGRPAEPFRIYCFTNARVAVAAQGGALEPNMIPVLEIANLLTSPDNPRLLDEEEIEFLAERTREIYGRQPWVSPDPVARRRGRRERDT